MKKDFLNISPESGGSTQVSVTADPNPQMKERSTTLNFSSTGGGGLVKAVNAVQAGVPYQMIQMYFLVYDRSTNLPVRSWVSTLQNSDGVLVFKMNENTYLDILSNENDIMIPAFFSDSSNTFTFEGKGPENEPVSGTFLKNGNVHTLNESLLLSFHQGVLGSISTNSKEPLKIKFNGTVIQQYILTE